MISLVTMSNTIRSIRKISRSYADPETICPDIMRELRRMQTELSGMIDALPNLTDRIIMSLVFLKGDDARTIAEGTGMSIRSVFLHMKHGKAELLRMFPEQIAMS